MGFWDFIAPDLEDFLEVSEELLPAGIAIRGVVLSGRELGQLAWASPGSGAGLALRLYYSARQYGLSSGVADALWDQVNKQAAAGGFGAGPGFGGSFSWEARPDMAALVIPNVYRVAIEATSGGQAVTNVVGVRGSGSGLALQAAQAVQTAWKVANGPLSCLPSTYGLLGFRSMDLSSLNGAIADVADAAVGTATTGSKSTNGACALVKWNGGTRSRSSRGRLYLGPIQETDIDNDGRTLMAARRTYFATAFTNFRSSLSSSGFTLCVISVTTSQAFDVASSAVEPIIATQRRRIRS